MIEKIYMLIEILLHVLKPSNKKILFSSFHGQYNDNPKYVSEKIHSLYPELELYWVISNKSKENDIPEYVRVLRYNTLRYCWMKNRCKVIVENGAGYHLLDSSAKMFGFKKLLKNKKQFDLSTWHGNPIKGIGAQIPGNEFWAEDTMFTTSDILLAGSVMIKEIFERAFLNKMPVELLGTPRTDVLFSRDFALKDEVKKKLGFPLDKKIVLYAPTYRNNVNDSGIEQMGRMDFDLLLSTLENKFGGEWIFVFRVHNMVLKAIDTQKITHEYGDKVMDGNKYDDMADYLFACDALISDFSGCVFDIALTDKPCFLYSHDRKKYEFEERGFYFPISDFPYDFSDDFDSLINCIKKFDSNAAVNRRSIFLKKIGNVEDGNASRRVADLVISKLNK